MSAVRRILPILFVLAASLSLFAQTDTGRLVGTITDSTGAVLPKATVTVTNVATGRMATTQTGDGGQYVVNALPPGNYHVEVKQQGFKTASADLTLEVSQVREVSLKLETGSVESVVNVTSEVPLVDTETSSTGEVIQGRQVTELPLNGRNFSQLALLTPGVSRGAYGDIASGGGSGTNAETFRNSETGGAALSVNGLRPQADNFILDGVDNNEGLVNTIVFFPPAEAIQEFRVNTSVAPAEFGRAGGAIVQTSIKSGTNDIHGSAFWFRRSGGLDAKPWNFTGPLNFKRNQFGAQMGAPVWKNKFFVFGDYQGQRLNQPLNVEFATVPTDKMRTGDFSELLGAGATLGHPTTTPACAAGNPAFVGKGYIFNPITCMPFGWNGVSATNIIPNPNPVGLAYLKGFPEPNVAGTIQQNFKAQRQSLRNFDDFDIRADLAATAKDSLFFRYSFSNYYFTVTNRLGPNNPSGFGSGNNINVPRGFAIGYTRTFTPNIVNEFHFGYIDTNYGYNPPNIGQALGQAIGIPGANPTPLLGGQVLIGGNNNQLEYQGDGGPYNVPQNLYEWRDSVSWSHGKHVFKFGTDLGDRHVNFVQGNNAKGYFILGGDTYIDSGRFTGYEVSELLAGFADYKIGVFNGLYQTRSWETGYFVQDDWRITNKLTLNLGLRYDLYTWPYEVHDQQSNFNPATGTLVLPGAAGYNRSLVNTDKNNFAPRLGFAYDLQGNGKTVVRGGYGIFYFLDRGGVGYQLSNNPNFNGVSSYEACPGGPNTCAAGIGSRITLSGQGPIGNNDWTKATGALPPAVVTTNPNNPQGVDVIYYPQNSQNSSIMQWNVQVQRSLGTNTVATVGYVGTKMDHLATAFNANQIPLGGGTKHWANINAVNEYAFIGNGRYDGLQTSLNRRFSKGLQFTASYTYSQTSDNSNGAFSTTGGGGANGRIFVDTNGNPLLNFNQGNSDNDIHHLFVFSTLYELPFGKGKQFASNVSTPLDYIIGGWQWTNIITLQSGSPMDLQFNGTPNNRPDVSGPVGAAIVNGKGVITGNFAQPPCTLNPCSLAGAVYTRPGTLSRNAIFGPGYHTWDMGMIKNFKITERFNTQFRFEAFNILNTPQFQNGSFNTTVGAGNGTSQTAQTRNESEREVQVALRISF